MTPRVPITYPAHEVPLGGLRSTAGARLFLVGGEPFQDELVMWWNFVGRTHEEIAEAWEDWHAASGRYGDVAGHGELRVPAPPLPTVRLLPRQRRSVATGQGSRSL